MSKYIIETKEGPSFLYDVNSSKLFLEDGKTLFYIDPLLLGKGSNLHHLSVVKIVLGTKCNYRCSYCSQAFSRKNILDTTLEDTKAFAQNLPNEVLKADRIEFWGGEPLVYLEHLKILIPVIREAVPNAMLSIVSNGALLTKEIGDFLAKYRVGLSISHDAYAHKTTRGIDILEDTEKVNCIKEVFSKINFALNTGSLNTFNQSCSFNSTLSSQLLDPYAVQQWFNNKVGEKVPVSCDPVLSLGGGINNSNIQFSEQDLKALCKHTYYAGLRVPGEYPYNLANIGMDFLRNLYEHKELTKVSPSCSVHSNRFITLDLKGNIYTCQNQTKAKNILGNIYNGTDASTVVNSVKYPSYLTEKHCANCPMAMLCKGGCSLKVLPKVAYIETCNAKFWFFLGIFSTAFKRITGYTPCKIKGDIIRPIKNVLNADSISLKKYSELEIPI